MGKYQFVELNTELEYLAKKGIHKGCTGKTLDISKNTAIVNFYNPKNHGDYAIAFVDIKYLKTNNTLTKKQIEDTINFFSDHKKLEKTKFSPTANFKEHDTVELLVEKEKFAKEGVHKGMRGTIFSDYAINGKWNVGFDIYQGEDYFNVWYEGIETDQNVPSIVHYATIYLSVHQDELKFIDTTESNKQTNI